MTLLRLAAALMVAGVVFVGWEWVVGRRDRRTAAVAAGEATVLALFAALFFGSLGHGGWWLVFPLIGVLASGRDRWLAPRATGPGTAVLIRATVIVATRYLLAGGLLSLLYR
jgi:hypothetical protein